MSKDNAVTLQATEVAADPLTELLRDGAKRLIQQAVEAELAELLGQYAGLHGCNPSPAPYLRSAWLDRPCCGGLLEKNAVNMSL